MTALLILALLSGAPMRAALDAPAQPPWDASLQEQPPALERMGFQECRIEDEN